MKLYGIKLSGNRLFIDSAEVRETRKLYKLIGNDFRSWLGYVSQVSKDSPLVFLSPDNALNAFIEEKEKRIKLLEDDLERERMLLLSARELGIDRGEILR